ncbi:MAG: glycosyltransferase, partial [Verrucomicrobiota bacterium]
MKNAPPLTLCMIVRNEERHLARCLESVKQIAGQMIVVDTGSTDSTVSIAKDFGAEVRSFEWCGDFSAARNASLAPATGRWILVLDADEWLAEPHAERVGELSRGEPLHAYDLIQKSTTAAGEILRNSMVRLFPNRPGIRYEHKIHEDVMGGLRHEGVPILKTDIEIEHSGYVDAGVLAAKARRNRSILEALVAEGCPPEQEPHMRFNLARTFYDDGEIAAALGQFEWCVANSPKGSRLSRMCVLRAADCLFLLGRRDEALARLPQLPHPNEHPGSLMLAAKILHASNPGAAQPWLETLLDAPDEAQAPPVPLGKYKLGAVAALAKFWFEQNRPNVASALLRLAQDMKSGAVDSA